MDEETCRLCFEHHHEVKKEIEVDTLEILIDSWKLTDLLALCSNKLFSIEKFLRTQKTQIWIVVTVLVQLLPSMVGKATIDFGTHTKTRESLGIGEERSDWSF
jgi:high-affinity K+ transport system ATPase subunit B